MPRILEITIPPDRTAAVLAEIEATEGLIGYRVERRASYQPAGDVVTLTTTNRSLHPLLRSLETRGLLHGSGWSIAINEPAGLIAPASRHDIDNDDNEVTWEEMDFTILRESNMTINSLLVMTTSGVLAATGIALGALHLVIAAMVIAPGFEPINRVSLDLVSGSGEWHRGISDVLKGYAALFGGAVLAAFVLSAAGRSLQAGGTYLSTSDLVSFWTQPTVPSLMVTAFAAAAGAVLIASNRSVLTAGVMIALALVPPVAIAGMALVGGDATLAGKALVRWVMEVLIVAAGGAAVFVWKRVAVQRRRAFH